MELIKTTEKDRITLYGEKRLFEEIQKIAEGHPSKPSLNQTAIALLEHAIEEYKRGIKY